MGIHYHDNCFCFQCYEDLHAPSTVHYEDIISVQAKPSLIHIRDDAPPAPETADDGTTTQPATLAFLSSWQPLEGADTPRPAVRKTENSVHHFCTMTGDVQLPDHLRGTWRRYHVPSKYNSVEAPIPEVSLGWQAETIFLYPPKRSLGGVYWIHPVRPSIRPWVGVRMITLILFSGFKFFFLHISLGSRSCMGLNISVLPH